MLETKTTIGQELKADEIGPELVLHFWDPEIQLKGVLVVDCTALGMAGGGTRMLPDISVKEIAALARAMTYKWAFADIPRGGAKTGIWGEPQLTGPKRTKIFETYGRITKPLADAGVVRSGEDMGTTEDDVRIIWTEWGIPYTGGFGKDIQKYGEPLENITTGSGVAAAAKQACELNGIDISRATVAVEGFGKVGKGLVRYLATEHGAKIAAVSTVLGAIYNKRGLDIEELFKLSKTFGDKAVLEYKDAKHIDKGELYFLPVDILAPGARPYVISEKNADRVQAKVISSGANIPITDEALELLYRRGITVIPDFISNSGGIYAAYCARIKLGPDETIEAIRRLVEKKTEEVLVGSKREGISPTKFAMNQVLQKIREARKTGKRATPEEALKRFKERIGRT